MKRINIATIMALLFICINYNPVLSGEFKPYGFFTNQYEFGTAGEKLAGLRGLGDTETFRASSRIHLGFDYIMSDDLSATFLTRTQFDYGVGEFDSALTGSTGASSALLVRLAYVDWRVPNTDIKVRLGYQPVSLPSFVIYSPIILTRGSGINIVAPINENIGLNAQWIRVETEDTNDLGNGDANFFSISLNAQYEKVRFMPYIAYVGAGESTRFNSQLSSPWQDPSPFVDWDSFNAWIIGGSFEWKGLSPLRLAVDGYYSTRTQNHQYDNSKNYEENGFQIALGAFYQTKNGVVSLRNWYASGDKYNSDGSIKHGEPFVIYAGMYHSNIFMGGQIIDNGIAGLGGAYNGLAGTWGSLLEWANFSYINKLSHSARILYIQGTNEARGGGRAPSEIDLTQMEENDYMVELNFDTSYQIYKNLTATLQLGVLFPFFELNAPAHGEDDDIYRVALSFRYHF